MDDKIFDKIHEVDLKERMETFYIDYAMSVIASPCSAGCPRRFETGTETNTLRNDRAE